MSVLSAPYMHDEVAAFAHIEAMLWPQGPVCPSCGSVGNVYVLEGVRSKASKKNPEGVVRHGLKKCRDCRAQFTVRVGTIFEDSHVKLHIWLQAICLMTSSKKGISSNQLHRTLGVTLKTAWFMSHRIREAMSDNGNMNFGSGGGVVEVDETFFGTEPGKVKKSAFHHKMKVFSLVDRTSGRAKSFVVDDLKASTLVAVMIENVAWEARIFTDEAQHYARVGRPFADHQTVNHRSGEYVRGEVSTNRIESFFSVWKRGMRGTYQHTSKRHLRRYLTEFDFRHNHRIALGVDDSVRADRALLGVVGKRLTYAMPVGKQ